MRLSIYIATKIHKKEKIIVPGPSPGCQGDDCNTGSMSDPHFLNLIPHECGQTKGGEILARIVSAVDVSNTI